MERIGTVMCKKEKQTEEIKKIIFGTWATSKKGWKGVNSKDAENTLEKAIELGIKIFDTAPIYGFGKSEEILGEKVKDIREKVIISSKCGLSISERGHVDHDLSPQSIIKDVEGSLKRLKTDYLDILFIHWPDPKTPIKKSLKTINQLKEQKITQNIGICNFSPELLKEATYYSDISFVQYEYNFLNRVHERTIIPICKRNNISFWAYSPFAQGLLTNSIQENYIFSKNDIRKLNPLFSNRNNFQKALKQREKLKPDMPVNALKFILKNEQIDGAIISMTKEKHLIDNINVLRNIKKNSPANLFI